MVYDGVLEGRYVDLKSVTVEDAEFTLGIRMDPELTKYLPRINNTLEQQIMWIKQQRRKPGDYFFVVWDKNGNRIGTNSIYNINGEEGESGRLAIRGNSFQSIEAQLLMSDFSYNVIGLENVVSYVQDGNDKALRYGAVFGGVVLEKSVDENGVILLKHSCTKTAFANARKKLERMLYR